MMYRAVGFVSILAMMIAGCQEPKAAPAAGASAPKNEQSMERQVTGLETKDHVKMNFHTILIWSPAVTVTPDEHPDPAAIEKLYTEALQHDLPKIIGDYTFGQIIAVHDNQPAITNVETRMAQALTARAAESAKGAAIDRFIVRRLDLNESVQRQGIDDLQRQRMQELWRGPIK